MAGVTVVVGMRMTGVIVVMVVVMIRGMVGHQPYSTRSMAATQPYPVLIRHYDTLPPRID